MGWVSYVSAVRQLKIVLRQDSIIYHCFSQKHSWFAWALKSPWKSSTSLKIEKLWDILGKPLNFSQKSSNIFESSLNKNNLCLKKVFCAKKRLNAQQYANFLGDQVSVRSTVQRAQLPGKQIRANPGLNFWCDCIKSSNRLS